MIRLEIRGRFTAPIAFELSHDTYCVDALCECIQRKITTAQLDRASGVRRPRETTIAIPRSLTLCHGVPSEPLREAALQCPGISAALAARTVRVVPAPRVQGIGQAPNTGGM